jgi:hypothetical protein
MRQLFPRRLRHRSFWPIVLLMLSICCGWGLAQGIQPVTAQSLPGSGPVDPLLAQYEAGQTAYLKNCATCHIALPPAVLPSQTWLNLLQDNEHYGASLQVGERDRRVIARYLNYYSRSLRADETVPYRVTRARHFQALHPQVKLPRPVTIETCATCHPQANVFNFREWQEAP